MPTMGDKLREARQTYLDMEQAACRLEQAAKRNERALEQLERSQRAFAGCLRSRREAVAFEARRVLWAFRWPLLTWLAVGILSGLTAAVAAFHLAAEFFFDWLYSGQ